MIKHIIFCVVFGNVFTWPHCLTKSDCNYHGDCINGYCSCNENWGGDNCFDQKQKDCQHGNYSHGICVCNPGWRTAGFTNTINWVSGSCTQYKCQSSDLCRSLTGFSDASCPITNWNCYCGFSHLGFQTNTVGCMSFFYSLSVAGFRLYKQACLIWIWKIVGIAALISLPFGTRRLRCDHHRSWLARFRSWKNGYSAHCRGECVRERRWKIRNDLSLSLYWLKSGVWWYAFLTLMVAFIVFVWSVILWILFIIAIIAAICAAMCGENSNSSCNDCTDANCCFCCENGGGIHTRNGVNIVYIGGPLPGETCCGCNGCDNCCSESCNKCCTCCKSWVYPFRWLIPSYPIFPSNLQGGVIGFLNGTHIVVNDKRRLKNRNTYVTRFLSLDWCRRQTDLRNNTNWQTIVQSHIQTKSSPTAIYIQRDNGIHVPPSSPSPSPSAPPLSLLSNSILKIANRVPLHIHQSCVSENENIWNLEHYTNNECWICNETASVWHVWDTCKHIYCETCSEKMIQDNIPCPLCREMPIAVDSYYAYSSILHGRQTEEF